MDGFRRAWTREAMTFRQRTNAPGSRSTDFTHRRTIDSILSPPADMKSLPSWLRVLAILALLLPIGAAGKPNIIFIMADDLGYTDVACFGSKYYETPNIDRLAAQGMRFTNYHQHQNCTPTRAALMSGQYSVRTGVYTVGGTNRFDWSKRPLRPVDNVTNLPLDRVILPQALKSAGYTTGMFGKWHIGNEGAFHPGKRGFDEAIVSQGAHFNFATNPKVEYPQGQYLADFLTDKAVDFIRRHREKSFFLYLPHFGVHSPHDAKPELVAKFKNKAPVGGHHSPIYAAMIASVDESVGRVMAVLDELKLADNTVLVFTSDNGGVGGYQREGIQKTNNITDNAPHGTARDGPRSDRGDRVRSHAPGPRAERESGPTPRGGSGGRFRPARAHAGRAAP
jgi:arylsulfatase A-like enzyme